MRVVAKRIVTVAAGIAVSITLVGQVTGADATSATSLRLTLGHLFAVHGYLSLEVMRAAALETPERAAVLASLGENSNALEEVLSSIYGADAGSRFGLLWHSQIDALLRYGDATAKRDQAAQAKARGDLMTFRTDFASFLTSLNPRLSGGAVADALQLRLAQLTAYGDGDFVRATTTGRATYSRMFEIGDELAKGIAAEFPKRYPGQQVAFGPKAELTVALRKFLGEHLVLAAEAMRAGVAGAPDAPSAKDSLAANTADLAAWVATVYGTDAGQAFDAVWTRQTDGYLSYMAGLRARSDPEKKRAREALEATADAIAKLLSSANPRLDREAVDVLIGSHAKDLIAQADAYAAADYPTSVSLVQQGYERMYSVADAMADATAAQFPTRFASVNGAPSTATEGLAGRPTIDMTVPVAVLAAAAVLAFALMLIGTDRRTPSVP